jgi:hypothetical protein
VEEIGLANAIQAIRQELAIAMAAGADEELRFRVGTVELQFQIVVTQSADASAKVRFWVVDVRAGGSVERAATHTIRIQLDPITSRGEEVEVRSKESQEPG